ncbi:MAG: IS3 family transposase [Thaumarchaeota archaeon]|nr:IS3 family transposase [Nitrososphaerota archaeon]
MSAAAMMRDVVGLNRSLRLCGVSKKAWYYKPRPRDVPPDPAVLGTIRRIAPQRPAYGTRRMAAQASRELNRPVNRKAVRRVFKRPGRSEPARAKREITRSNRKVPDPDRPNQFRESGMSYTWCGTDGRCYCFNVVDAFGRRRASLVLSDRATRHEAIMAVNNAVAGARPPIPGLTLRADNGSQYTGRDFRASTASLGISPEYIYVNTPEQNGHVESFHKTLKGEYVWPREFQSLEDAREAPRAAFDGYRNERPHSSLGCMAPSGFLELWRQWQDGRGGAETGKQRIIGGWEV